MRLSRFTWHQQLFRAFDTLKLTPSEIAGLVKWDGTRWARGNHEQETRVKIKDTTGDCIYDWVDPELRRPHRNAQQKMETGEGVTKDWGSLMDGIEACSTPTVARSNILGQTSTTPIPQHLNSPQFLQDIVGPNIEHRDTPVPGQGSTALGYQHIGQLTSSDPFASVGWYFR